MLQSRLFSETAKRLSFDFATLDSINNGHASRIEMCFKVWEEITIPRFASHLRYGAKAGQPNPRFIDAKLFKEMVPTPYRDAKFEAHAGQFLFEFQRHDLSTDELYSRLDGFFGQLPKDFSYAVEIRNAGLIGPEYQKVLENHGVAHVYNYWSYMPWQSNTSGWGASQLPSLC